MPIRNGKIDTTEMNTRERKVRDLVLRQRNRPLTDTDRTYILTHDDKKTAECMCDELGVSIMNVLKTYGKIKFPEEKHVKTDKLVFWTADEMSFAINGIETRTLKDYFEYFKDKETGKLRRSGDAIAQFIVTKLVAKSERVGKGIRGYVHKEKELADQRNKEKPRNDGYVYPDHPLVKWAKETVQGISMYPSLVPFGNFIKEGQLEYKYDENRIKYKLFLIALEIEQEERNKKAEKNNGL
jgi:hypothetical protein